MSLQTNILNNTILPRKVVWFSHGVASTIALKLAVDEYRRDSDPRYILTPVTIELVNEHPDNARFRADVARWLNVEIAVIRDEKYGADVNSVIKHHRYMSGAAGARCTKELKKAVRLAWQRNDDIHVFGFTSDERHRHDNLIDNEPELILDDVLLRHELTKRDCFELFQTSGIALPAMYLLGYHNNNCIGCLKASGAGYWNKIRVDFPEVFAARAKQEQLLGVAMVLLSDRELSERWPGHYRRLRQDADAGVVAWKTKTDRRGDKEYVRVRVPLRYLPEDAGSHKDLDIGACGMVCESRDERRI